MNQGEVERYGFPGGLFDFIVPLKQTCFMFFCIRTRRERKTYKAFGSYHGECLGISHWLGDKDIFSIRKEQTLVPFTYC